MEESDASRSVSDSFSTLIDGAEALDSGYAAGRSGCCEDEAYGDVSLASKANHANDSHGPSSKRTKVALMMSGRKISKPKIELRGSYLNTSQQANEVILVPTVSFA